MVRLGASRCANLGWKMYDEQFRLRKAQDPASSWSLVDYELWLIYMNIIQNSKLNSNWIISLRLNAVHRNYICKLRTSNIKFSIETGRWMGIPRDERLCNLCNLCIGNEFHYIFCCELLKDIRTKYMPNYFIICPCEAKMNTLLKIGNTQVLTHLSLFLQKIVKLL